MLPLQRHTGPPRESPLLRWRVRMRALELDERLAAGENPIGSPELELRTLQLCTAESRWMLARALRRLVNDAEGNESSARLSVRLRRPILRSARASLRELADVLEDPEVNAICGIARASWLLGSGNSPLYTKQGVRLLTEIEETIDVLWKSADGA